MLFSVLWYILLHFSLLKIGTYSSRNFSHRRPPTFRIPQPVTTPLKPTKLFPVDKHEYEIDFTSVRERERMFYIGWATLYTFRRQAHWVDSGFRTKLHALSVQAQQGDVMLNIVIILMFDHLQNTEIHVFCFCVVIPIVFQKSHNEGFWVGPVLSIVQYL